CVCLVAVVAVISLLPQTGAYLNVNKLDISKTLSSIDVKKEDGRQEYLSTLGYTATEEPVSKTSEKIPEVFDATTEKYNELQRVQGFDLERYGGKKVTGYTYEISSLPDGTKLSDDKYLATLIVYKNKVVAADLCCPGRQEYYPLVRVS
ncbi:MAG: DUF4830 domain-containing protein, partial [Clostridia bacterium]|nr:DUF4830 domain-containing protein [Clostridia bacterium]